MILCAFHFPPHNVCTIMICTPQYGHSPYCTLHFPSSLNVVIYAIFPSLHIAHCTFPTLWHIAFPQHWFWHIANTSLAIWYVVWHHTIPLCFTIHNSQCTLHYDFVDCILATSTNDNVLPLDFLVYDAMGSWGMLHQHLPIALNIWCKSTSPLFLTMPSFLAFAKQLEYTNADCVWSLGFNDT